jgi:hypothetical protein
MHQPDGRPGNENGCLEHSRSIIKRGCCSLQLSKQLSPQIVLHVVAGISTIEAVKLLLLLL